jgi:ADP-heptose:LPS heptosyltransferase
MKIFEHTYNALAKEKITKLFWGMISIVKSPNMKKFFLFGLHVATAEIKDYKEIFYLRTPNLFTYKNIKKGLKQIVAQVPHECDSVYYISTPTGEGYILANILSELIKKNKSKNPYILLRNSSLDNIFNNFCPSIKNKKVFVVERDLEWRKLCQSHHEYKGKNIYVFFRTRHYFLQDRKILGDKSNQTHFFQYVLDSLHVKVNPGSFCVKNLIASDKILEEKIKNLNLNWDKFVIFAPEANTSLMYPLEFYVNLAKKLQNKGYDVFWNLCKTKTVDQDIKTAMLSYDELFVLAKKSKGVIGLRSGLFDLLSGMNEFPKFVLYTEFPPRGKKAGQYYTSEKALVGFSLKKLPNVDVNKIYEFDTNKLDSSKITQLIIDGLTGESK